MESLSIIRPDDWHVHFRDGDVLADIVPLHARRFGRAIVMPNLKPPVATTDDALAYYARIEGVLETGSDFQPLMTLYLTDRTTPDEIARAHESGKVFAVKFYPAGATTNSDSGVTNIHKVYPALKEMAQLGMPLLVHGEVTSQQVDIFDREAEFLETVLKPLLHDIPDLRVVSEHITTADMADFVEAAGDNVAATITPQHLLYNRNEIFKGGIRPHYYCLPVLKREKHRERLVEAATSGSQKYFLGTDSAPHATEAKESGCGCAGIFSGHAAIELYALVFEQAGALDKLEGFASFHGADFYNLPRNSSTITLIKKDWEIPRTYRFGKSTVTPLLAGEILSWQLQ
ncbi:MAG: dihydroorotase [Candidatus Sedimenticola sp. 20ELBAFRAG]